MGSKVNQKLTLASLIVGLPKPSDFQLIEEPLRELGPQEVLVKNLFCSIDPGIRPTLSGTATYAPAVKLGGTIPSATVSQVIQSNDSTLPEGTYVTGGLGWQTYSICNSKQIRPIPEFVKEEFLSEFLTLFGLPGMTAYFGLLEIGKLKENETVLISSAAGAVGSIAGQIARIHGAKVIGIAGGYAKCELITQKFKFDHAIDYKSCADLSTEILKLAPQGVNLFLDNVGGKILNAGIESMAKQGRIILSGMTSEYNAGNTDLYGIRNPLELISRRLKLEGFVVLDYMKRFSEAFTQLYAWTRNHQLTCIEDRVEGLEAIPKGFISLFQGNHYGRKMADLTKTAY